MQYTDERSATESNATKIIKQKTELLECESEIQVLNYEIEDSKEFLKEIQDKSEAISDSIRVGENLQSIIFKICPSCFSEIELGDKGGCHLCGSRDGVENAGKPVNLLRMKNEIDIQIRESSQLLSKKNLKKEDLQRRRKEIRNELRQLVSKVSSTTSSLNSNFEAEIYDNYRKIGEIEEKILTLDRIGELHESIQELTAKRSSAQEEVNRLSGLIALKENRIIQREPEIKSLIGHHLKSILKEDIGIEKEFESPEEVDFDFASNTIAVNKKVAFSESGTVYLNNAFRVALLLASLEKDYLRLPRFMILDGIENGGMEESRSRNFQSVVKQHLDEYDIPHQIIFATKSISNDLNSEQYIVGETYSKEQRSLDI